MFRVRQNKQCCCTYGQVRKVLLKYFGKNSSTFYNIGQEKRQELENVSEIQLSSLLNCTALRLRTNQTQWCTFWHSGTRLGISQTHIISLWMPHGFAIGVITNFSGNIQKNSVKTPKCYLLFRKIYNTYTYSELPVV